MPLYMWFYFIFYVGIHQTNSCISCLPAAKDEIRHKNIVNAKGLSPEENRRKYG